MNHKIVTEIKTDQINWNFQIIFTHSMTFFNWLFFPYENYTLLIECIFIFPWVIVPHASIPNVFNILIKNDKVS